MHQSHRLIITTGLFASSILFTGAAQASGFAIIEHSVTGLGTAFASGAAGAEDATTIFFNPAGMTYLKGAQANLAVHIISPNAKFDDAGSTHLLGGNLNVNNNDGGEAGPTAYVPNFYYTRPLNAEWSFGLGVNAPFGLESDFDNGWVGRYHALKSELKTVNINPSLAYKANEKLSLGFGINAQYIDARLTNAVDFGTIFAATMAVAPQAADGEAQVEGDDWSFGYNLGLMYQATPQTRIGAAYRSRIKHTLEGDAEFTSSALVQTLIAGFGGGRFVNTDAEADVTLPDSLSVGFHHQVDAKWSVIGDVTWTNWSKFDELRIEFDNPVQPDAVTTTDWEDSNRYSLGLTYKANDKWTWRGGVAFDETPIPNAQARTPRIPDEDRTWITIGFSYTPSKNMTFDLGYAHLFIDDAEVRKSVTVAEDALRGSLVGEFDIDVNILSAQARWTF